MTWIFEGKEVNHLSDLPPESYGFVYIITEIPTGRKYIGQKRLWSGKTKKKRKETNWKRYFGSSRKLQEEIEIRGESSYSREIVFVCTNKAEMNFLELKEQMDNDVLFTDEYYNEYIGARITSRGLGRLKDTLNV